MLFEWKPNLSLNWECFAHAILFAFLFKILFSCAFDVSSSPEPRFSTITKNEDEFQNSLQSLMSSKKLLTMFNPLSGQEHDCIQTFTWPSSAYESSVCRPSKGRMSFRLFLSKRQVSWDNKSYELGVTFDKRCPSITFTAFVSHFHFLSRKVKKTLTRLCSTKENVNPNHVKVSISFFFLTSSSLKKQCLPNF